MAKTFVFPSSIMVLNLIAFITISSLLISLEARRLKLAKPEKIEAFTSGILNVKIEGPSSRGQGHRFTMAHTLGGIKNSGPSPGEGNSHTDGVFSKTIGGIKHSSMSHHSVSQILKSEIKQSGMSPSGSSQRGEGHKFTMAHTLGGIKNSGPSPGEGNSYTDGAFSKTIGGIKHLGPSHRSASQILVSEIKQYDPSPSVPSPKREGHGFTMAYTLGGIKNSGPSHGKGNSYIDGTFSKTTGGIKHSGSNHGNAPQIPVLGIKHSGPSPGQGN